MPDLFGPEAALLIDAILLVLLVAAIGVGLMVLARLRGLKRALREWEKTLGQFGERASAAEVGLARISQKLSAEAVRRAAETQAATAEPGETASPEPRTSRPMSPSPSILSMQ